MLISAECEIADPFAAACHGHVTKNTTLVKFIKFISFGSQRLTLTY